MYILNQFLRVITTSHRSRGNDRSFLSYSFETLVNKSAMFDVSNPRRYNKLRFHLGTYIPVTLDMTERVITFGPSDPLKGPQPNVPSS